MGQVEQEVDSTFGIEDSPVNGVIVVGQTDTVRRDVRGFVVHGVHSELRSLFQADTTWPAKADSTRAAALAPNITAAA